MALDGKWELKFNTPMGEQSATVDLAVDGGTLKVSTAAGPGAGEVQGTVDGDSFAWKNTVAGPMGPLELSWAGKMEGEGLAGTVQFGAFGSGNFKGTRK
jgi:hypothetical protein